MGHFRSNIQDVAFNIFDVFDTGAVLSHDIFGGLDEDTARAMLSEAAKLAEGPIAASFVEGDRQPPVFDPDAHSVTLPGAIKKSWQDLRDSEWWRIEAEPELGGQVVPRTLVWGIGEQFLGANPSLQIYTVGVPFAGIIWRNGTDLQKQIAQRMIENGWTSTMMLTEPDAGSDVGAAITRATQQADGMWHITGVKRFITSGDHDLADNIVHLVLARPEGAGPGTKGLSLFIVPKFHFDLKTGELGERNGVYVTNLEHKMGLVASATCEVRLGENPDDPATGWLMGDIHDGIAQMFEAIEHSRMFVGVKAVATLSAGYAHALAFAKTRVQSGDMTRLRERDAARVQIIRHPDVRRALMLIKAYVEGLRSLIFYAASVQDKILIAASEGEVDRANHAINDLLLPVVKGVCSERAYELLAQALQILGGSGYLKDYPLEQYIRDSKIDTLYEGTTAIQAQDFFFRKVLRDKGVALAAVLEEISAFTSTLKDSALEDDARAVDDGAENLRSMVGAMTIFAESAAQDERRIYLVGQHTTRLLMSVGDVLVGYLLLRQAFVASRRLEELAAGSTQAPFLYGKIATAHFFASTVLPGLSADRSIILGADNSIMDLDDSAF